MYEILQIKQMKDFCCTSSNCVDTCCHSWAILINKSKYKKYKKENIVDMKNFTIIDKHNSNNYAKINLNSDGNCPFLCKDGLCKIHKNSGYKNLSDVCKTYPRKKVKYNDFIEISISLSCPAALDILFASDKPLEFDLDSNNNKITEITGNEDGNIIPGLNNDACFTLRSLAISIVQNRELPLKERLFSLGAVCNIVQNLIDNKYESKEILAYLHELEKTFKEEKLLRYKNETSVVGENKFVIIQKLLPIVSDMMSGVACKHKDGFKEHLENSLKNISDIEFEDLKECKSNLLQNFFDNNEYILEHYIVSKLFSDIFPKETKSVDASYDLLLSKLLVLQMLMIVLYKNNKELNIKDIKNAMYLYERQIDHSNIKKKLIMGLTTKLNFDWSQILELIF